MTIFKKIHSEFDDYIDTSIYRNGYFRLQNQTNKKKPLPHKIIRGDMDDFIVNQVMPDTKKLPIKIIESNTKENKIVENKIKIKLLIFKTKL